MNLNELLELKAQTEEYFKTNPEKKEEMKSHWIILNERIQEEITKKQERINFADNDPALNEKITKWKKQGRIKELEESEP